MPIYPETATDTAIQSQDTDKPLVEMGYPLKKDARYILKRKSVNYKTTRNYLLSKPEAIEYYPFGPEVAVFKVKSKMFALLFLKNEIESVNLKCEPYRAAALRDVFDAVTPGYHMNKLHWNTVILDASIPSVQIREMIDHSYARVVKGLKKIEKNALILAYGEAEIYKAL